MSSFFCFCQFLVVDMTLIFVDLAPNDHSSCRSNCHYKKLFRHVGPPVLQLQGQREKKRLPTGMSCWYLVNGLFHAYISRLFTSPKVI